MKIGRDTFPDPEDPEVVVPKFRFPTAPSTGVCVKGTLVECLLSMPDALSLSLLIPSTTKTGCGGACL